MSRRHLLLLLLVGVPLTLAACGFTLLVTAIAACGISGCSGGGFGPSYSPTEGQVGILVTGLTLVPLAVLSMPRRPWAARLAAAAVVAAGGSLAALILLGLSVNGCPQGLDRMADRGSTTCDDGRG